VTTGSRDESSFSFAAKLMFSGDKYSSFKRLFERDAPVSRLNDRPLLAAALALALGVPAHGAALNEPSSMPQRILAAQNALRAEAGVAPLVWDPALGQDAAGYALQLALTNNFHHSDRRARPNVGENLWMGSHGYFSYEAMVGGWASEKRFFVPGTFPNNSRTGNWFDVAHYTQIVWPTTTRVGCALASNARNDFLVCRYSPAGNIDGRLVG
jgi:hypothetical protein